MPHKYDAVEREDMLYTLECGYIAFPTNLTYLRAQTIQKQYERIGYSPLIRAWCEKPR